MANEHWIDRLSKALAAGPSRRGFLKLAGAAVVGLLVGDAPVVEAQKKPIKCTSNLQCPSGLICGPKRKCICVTDAHCPDGAICDSKRGKCQRICFPQNLPCENTNQCCDSLVCCGNICQKKCQCASQDERWTKKRPCCAGLEQCDTGLCAQPGACDGGFCSNTGETCATSNECCGSLKCCADKKCAASCPGGGEGRPCSVSAPCFDLGSDFKCCQDGTCRRTCPDDGDGRPCQSPDQCKNDLGPQFSCCSGFCRNLFRNKAHCGACNQPCDRECCLGQCCPSSDMTCQGGNPDTGACICAPPLEICTGNRVCCNTARTGARPFGEKCCSTATTSICVELGTDQRCEGCAACPAGNKCCNGKCVNLNADETCGESCDKTEDCTRKPGFACCSGKCVDLCTAEDNCGECGCECVSAAELGLCTCNKGVCSCLPKEAESQLPCCGHLAGRNFCPTRPRMPSGEFCCPAGARVCRDGCIPRDNCCVDGDCPNGQKCTNGTCGGCPSGTKQCFDGQCRECCSPQDCDWLNGQACRPSDGRCVDTCASSDECYFFYCCDGRCVGHGFNPNACSKPGSVCKVCDECCDSGECRTKFGATCRDDEPTCCRS